MSPRKAEIKEERGEQRALERDWWHVGPPTGRRGKREEGGAAPGLWSFSSKRSRWVAGEEETRMLQ